MHTELCIWDMGYSGYLLVDIITLNECEVL